jgi:hypothetical protein
VVGRSSACDSEEAGDDLLGLLGEHLLLLGQVGLPGGGVPDLDPVTGTMTVRSRLRPA